MMKTIILLLLLTLATFAQEAVWGQKILMGSEFTATDSIRLFNNGAASPADTLVNDSLYTARGDVFTSYIHLPRSDEGIWFFSYYANAVSSQFDSIRVRYRYGIAFSDPKGRDLKSNYSSEETGMEWGPWNVLLANAKTDTLYHFRVDPTDTTNYSWHKVASGYQYEVKQTSTDTDTALHKLTDFRR